MARKRATNPVTEAGPLTMPIQLWIPQLGGSPGHPDIGRDFQRATAVWAGDVTVWLAPEFQKGVRWLRHGFLEMALPAEHVDRLDIYHIDAKGRIAGPGATDRFPQGRVGGLLSSWLNVGALGGCRSVPAPETIRMEFPGVSAETVWYDSVTIPVEAGPTFPQGIDETRGRGRMYWPPESRALPSARFPEAESFAANPPISKHQDDEGAPLATYSDGTVAQRIVSLWPAPLGVLMPVFSAFEDLIEQRQMAQLALGSVEDPEGALRAAREAAAPYLTLAHTSRLWAWLYPTLLRVGAEPILSRAEEAGVPAAILQEAYRAHRGGTLRPDNVMALLDQCPTWHAAMGEPVLVRRALGPLGLFWALLLEELEARRPFLECERCHRIIRGKRDKRLCGPEDNVKCYRPRRAADQRRSRARRGPHGSTP